MAHKRLFLIPTCFIMMGIATVAIAQPTAAPTMMGGQRLGMMSGTWDIDDYLTALKTQIAITPDQEAAWKIYAQTLKNASEQMQALHQNMISTMGAASWPARRALMDQMLQSRQDSFQTVRNAADQLMKGLSPAQQQQARLSLPGCGAENGLMRQP